MEDIKVGDSNIKYNSDDDYIYINGKKWRKAGLNKFILYSAEDNINTLIKNPYGPDTLYPQDVSLCTFGDNGLILKCQANKSAGYYSPKIDVTNYNYLCVKSTSLTEIILQEPLIALLSSIDGYAYSNMVFRYDDIDGSGTFMVNIADITGEVYPYIMCVNGRAAIIYDFWLE